MVEFLMAIEEDFDIQMPDSQTCEKFSIEEFVNLVNEKLNRHQQ